MTESLITRIPFVRDIVASVQIRKGTVTEDLLSSDLRHRLQMALLPRGTIVMWYGSPTSIPQGWAICDGTNGTPDLRDRFILGCSDGEDPRNNLTGGSHTKTLTTANLPAHTHPISSSGTHRHRVGLATDSGTEWAVQTSQQWTRGFTDYDGDHNHGGSTGSTGGGQAFDVRPKYFKLIFIMKL